MKLVSFVPKGWDVVRLGAVEGSTVVDLSDATGGQLPSDMIAFLEGGDASLALARTAVHRRDPRAVHELAAVRLKAPLPRPSALRDFFAFEAHAKAGAKRRNEELAPEWYELPVYYKGNHREIYGPDEEVPWPYYTRRLDFECEIACVVGAKGRDLSVDEAAKHIAGYMIFNDWSARDIQKSEMVLRMGPAKGKDFANSFGPYLVTADEVDPKRDFHMTVKVNGETWSEGEFADQHWGFPTMVSHVSQCETVYPGDVLGSGTFHKGCGLDLDRWVKPGDVVELSVPALGTLRSKVGAPKEQRKLVYS